MSPRWLVTAVLLASCANGTVQRSSGTTPPGTAAAAVATVPASSITVAPANSQPTPASLARHNDGAVDDAEFANLTKVMSQRWPTKAMNPNTTAASVTGIAKTYCAVTREPAMTYRGLSERIKADLVNTGHAATADYLIDLTLASMSVACAKTLFGLPQG